LEKTRLVEREPDADDSNEVPDEKQVNESHPETLYMTQPRSVSLIAHAGFSAPRIVGWSVPTRRRDLITILIVLVVLMLLGVIPAWPHSRSWGYGPSGGMGLVLVVLLILLLTGRL